MGTYLAARPLITILLAVGVVLVPAGCSFGDGGAEATASTSPTAVASGGGSPTSTPTVAATAAADVVFLDARPIEVVPGRAELPSDLALVVVRGGELRRIHRAPNGVIEERLLFDPFAYSSTRLMTFTGIQISGPALRPGQLAITACSTGDCPGLSAASADALATVFRSGDGGVSWTASTELDGVARVISGGGASGELVLQRLAREGDGRTDRFEWWPSGRVIDPPTAWNGEGEPAALPDGRLLWWTADGRLIDADGRAAVDLADELTGGSVAQGIAMLASEDGNRLAVTWQENPPDSRDGPLRWSIYRMANGEYELSDVIEPVWPGVPVAWLSDHELLSTAELDWTTLGEPASESVWPRLPVILDIVAGTATAIGVPGNTLGEGWAVAMQHGPFAEINAGEGDCLNLRAAPALDGGILRCLAHGALLERLSPLDGEWVNVRTSDGVDGWVSGEFVRQVSEVAATATSVPGSAEPTVEPTATD